jgi:hypothetical protein
VVRKAGDTMTRRRRSLDEPYINEITHMERLQAILRILAHHELTPLPQRIRRRCAAMFVRLTSIRRELARHPEVIAAERAREDERGP